MTLLAAFQVLLYRYTDQEEIRSGRRRQAVAQRNLPGRSATSSIHWCYARSFQAMDRSRASCHTRKTALAAFEHQDYPFDLLVKQLQPERDPARSPLFQAMFAFQQGDTTLKLGDLPVESIALDQQAAQFELSLTVAEVASDSMTSFEYNTDLFDASTIERLSEHFQILLESVVADPSVSLSALPLLSNATRQQILYDWNDTRANFAPLVCVHESFAQRATCAPDRIAIAAGQETLSYRELNKRANRLAHYPAGAALGPEVRVGICVPRSAAMLTCVLGVQGRRRLRAARSFVSGRTFSVHDRG